MSKLRGYFRADNWKTWLSMLITLVGFFIPALLNAIYDFNKTIYWVLFAVSMICFALFVILAARYVERWHNIIDTLKRKNASLYKTVSLYAVMNKSEAAHHTNNALNVEDIDVTYQFNRQTFLDSNDNLYFPFTVEYNVQGRANRAFSTLYFHMLGHKSSQKIKGMDIMLDGKTVTPRQEDDQGNVQVISFSDREGFKMGRRTDYSIKIPFENVSGLAANRQQAFLFLPRNISNECGKNASAHIRMIYPSELKIAEKFNINLRKYLDGLNVDPQFAAFAPYKTSDEKGNTILAWNRPLNRNDMSSIYLVEMIPNPEIVGDGSI